MTFAGFYTALELAPILKLDPSTIRRMFLDEQGVIKIGESKRRGKRSYITLRIPAAVVERVLRRLGM